MSLFDLIKYPISDDITTEEYNALPEGVKKEYLNQKGGLIREVRRANSSGMVDTKDLPLFISLLRRIVAEHEV